MSGISPQTSREILRPKDGLQDDRFKTNLPNWSTGVLVPSG